MIKKFLTLLVLAAFPMIALHASSNDQVLCKTTGFTHYGFFYVTDEQALPAVADAPH